MSRVMELRDRKVGDIYANITSLDSTWYDRHKNKIWATIVIVAVILIVAVLYIVFRCSNCKTDSSEDLLKWDKVCWRNVSECPSSFAKSPPLLLISLDGFRVDYLNWHESPTLARIAECGAKADYLLSSYPSKTFPNHYSIVTGVYPYLHGIIDNNMYDEKLKQTFKPGKNTTDDPRWWQREPIWVTAQKQGKRAATFFWPGSDVKINGSYPKYYERYNGSVPFATRVAQILDWLMLDDRPDFLTLYFEEPDKSGHATGPNSIQTKEAVRKVDAMLNELLAGLQERNLTNCVNIIIASDHGMSGLDCDRKVELQKYLNLSDVRYYAGAFGRLKPKNNRTSLSEITSQLRCENKHMRVYRKEELPIRMHYADNKRIEPVIVDIDQRYNLVNRETKKDDWACSGGTHGYDNLFPDMRAIFFAYGPSFKSNITIHPILNVELYELMCELININPQPNNGTEGSLHNILKKPRELKPQIQRPSLPVAEVPTNSQSPENSTNCSCFQKQNRSTDIGNLEKKLLHLPFGEPFSSTTNNDLLLLINDDYVLAYDTKKKFPRWASFTTNQTEIDYEKDTCWSSDSRVKDANCKSAPEDFYYRPLYSPEFSHHQTQNQTFFFTNALLKFKNHSSKIEGVMNEMIVRKVRDVSGPINVLTGAAFDPQSEPLRKNLNSSIDLTYVPSHIFVIMTWCSTYVQLLNECDARNLDVQSFLLPNYPFPNNCEEPIDMIRKNAARVVDIETLTDTSIYTNLTTFDAVRLRTSISHFTL